jgi:hypothetical protein
MERQRESSMVGQMESSMEQQVEQLGKPVQVAASEP